MLTKMTSKTKYLASKYIPDILAGVGLAGAFVLAPILAILL